MKALRVLAKDIVILVDTREQHPYRWSDIAWERATLRVADYSVRGLVHWVLDERKSLDDFVNSVRVEREWRKLAHRLTAMGKVRFPLLHIEGSVEDVLDHRYISRYHPHSVMARIHQIETQYKVPVRFCGDREVAQRYVTWFLLTAYGRAIDAGEA